MENSFFAVIMAGGGGTRLWPLSRSDSPKQTLKLFGERSLFQTAIDRLDGLFSPDHIFIVTVKDQAKKLMLETPQIPVENFLIEPMPKGTASVIGLAAIHLTKKNPESIMCILTADHMIENVNSFQKKLVEAQDLARQGFLVTLGIKPTYPSSAYGYIHRGKLISKFQAYNVARFVEKPDAQKAQEYISSGNYYWNSGMFIWKTSSILGEFHRCMPDLAKTLDEIAPLIYTSTYQALLPDLWEKIKPQTIDYGVMEKAKNVVVLPAVDLGWNDIGSWDSLLDMLQRDVNGNIILANENINISSHNCLIKQDGQVRLIATAGLEDLVIIDTDNALLICKRGETQQVRKIVEILKEKNRTEYL